MRAWRWMARWLIADRCVMRDASISYFYSIGGEVCVHTFEMQQMITK